MLNTIKSFFETHVAPAPGRESHSIELATAALLIEVCRTDRLVTDGELQVVLLALQEKFGLAADEARTLMNLAEDEIRGATDYYQFTSLINQTFTQSQKERVIELMWQVAYADTHLDAHELHVMRRIAGLLHVTDAAYIDAKLRARDGSRQRTGDASS
jgi:uncharacterized tellurite resistance protein B-like protein